MEYIKSPMNYIGNKYRIIDQIQKLFPDSIGIMVDLFCGGCDVAINTRAQRIIANDINYHVIDIFKDFQRNGRDFTLEYIDNTIKKWNLTKYDKDAYLKFREYYNSSERKPLDLYVLMCFSFNYQFRFNSAHEYNNPFGANRSSFNDSMRNNLIRIFDRINSIEFVSHDFPDFDIDILNSGDFLYADPPYLLTCGSYNDGKRGFRGWTEQDEADLLSLLNRLNTRGVKFALSNVSHHKGKTHDILLNWQQENGYVMHDIVFNYNNCNYQTNNKNNITQEVLITNY